ncbi:MAG: OsmC family protein, partial [Myxococcales bacterium]|nr:OsmC family protein [Myxococcales bacterium]
LRSLEVDIEGSIDLNGVFGLGDVRPGLFDARLTLHVDSDAEAKVLQEILEATRSRSPVFDTVTKPVAVRTEVRKVA